MHIESTEMLLEQLSAPNWLNDATPADRDSILARLGYTNYSEYLFSPLWEKIRRRVLKRDEHKCFRCRDKANEVHHLAYTEAVLLGEDDSKLASLCAECHNKVEFDEFGRCRTDMDGQRVLEDRESARREKAANAEDRRIRKENKQRVKLATGGLCAWCKGNTEIPLWTGDGIVYLIPTVEGNNVEMWLCSGCASVLDCNKVGSRRPDKEKLILLSKKAPVYYTRPIPGLGFNFTKAFWRLNAMQREGIRNEYEWNCTKIKRCKPSTELQERFEKTKVNGRERRNVAQHKKLNYPGSRRTRFFHCSGILHPS